MTNLNEHFVSGTTAVSDNANLKQHLIAPSVERQTLRDSVEQALHNYFNVSDALEVDVAGLDGLTYLDKLDAGNAHVQQGDWNLRDPRDPGRSDRIYTQARGHYVLRDPGFGRSIDITTQGSRSAVVWNAGEAAAAKMDDIGAGWRNYVCVEAGNVGPDLIELAPGGSHVLKQVFEVRPL